VFDGQSVKRALVTGGAGFIGSNLVHSLHRQGWTVHVLDDMSNGHLSFLEPLRLHCQKSVPLSAAETDPKFITVVQTDFAHAVETMLSRDFRYDTVFHLAANPRVEYSVNNPVETLDVNVRSTQRLIDAVRRLSKQKRPRIIFSSSCSVYGDALVRPTTEGETKSPNSPYALQKWMAEELFVLAGRLYGVDSVCLRYFNVFGPRQFGDSPYSTAVSSWCDAIHHGRSLRSDGDGEQTRDMVFVDDVVKANIAAALRPGWFGGDVFNVGSGRSVSNNQILELLSKRHSGLVISTAPTRAGDVRHTLASVDRLRSTFPECRETTSFVDGLDMTLEWWSKQ